MSVLRVAILGSTGSIGRQAIEVAAREPERVKVVALAAFSNVRLLANQAQSFGVTHLAVADSDAGELARTLVPAATVITGHGAAERLLDEVDVDVVLNSLVGAAGLRASLKTLNGEAVLALANKESLVAGGELVTSRARPGQLIPVDSEHSAIFQCLLGEDANEVARLWLTASGGPFRDRTLDQLEHVTPAEALAHPTWSMGPKITVDSATLMNKGLEVIEAHHLFAAPYDAIRVVLQPQSCIHSMVEFVDGSVKAHLGATDMRIPIQYAFSHPRRWPSPAAPVDFAALGQLDFGEPDTDTFRCLALALEAGRSGGTMPAVLNAANEIAVAAFLAGDCTFAGIADTVAAVMQAHAPEPLSSIEQVEAVDAWARDRARKLLF